MPDITRFSPQPTWSDAFAALPQEAPDDSVWPRIAAHLETRTACENIDRDEAPASPWPARWALAASLFALTALPFVWYAFDREPESQAPPIASAESDRVTPPSPRPTPAPATDNTAAASAGAVSTNASAASSAASVASRDFTRERAATRDRALRLAPAHHAREFSRAAIAYTPHAVPVSADNGAPRAADDLANLAPGTTGAPTPWPDAPVQVDLERLYDVSAQLETLLALSRDSRVESGPAAALSSDFDAALALIDDRLARPDLPVAERESLWQARVETLQQAAGFEGQLRLLAAQGQRFDGTLVGVD